LYRLTRSHPVKLEIEDGGKDLEIWVGRLHDLRGKEILYIATDPQSRLAEEHREEAPLTYEQWVTRVVEETYAAAKKAATDLQSKIEKEVKEVQDSKAKKQGRRRK
jgi:hypothetical protein